MRPTKTIFEKIIVSSQTRPRTQTPKLLGVPQNPLKYPREIFKDTAFRALQYEMLHQLIYNTTKYNEGTYLAQLRRSWQFTRMPYYLSLKTKLAIQNCDSIGPLLFSIKIRNGEIPTLMLFISTIGWMQCI